jgi:hypothetical protein
MTPVKQGWRENPVYGKQVLCLTDASALVTW